APITCPSAPTTIVFKEPPPPPPPGIRLNFEHKLNVQSKLDEKSKPGVDIAEISVTDTDPNFEFPPNYFAGITDYTRLAERNLTVVLEAPASRESPVGSFTSWTGSCAPVAGNPRQCSVSFEFSVLGGQNKTVTANYSSSLTAPIVLTNPLSCDANGGKVSVYLQSAVSGATGYHIYRSTSSFTAMRKNFIPVAYAQTVTELDSDKNSANGITPFTTAPTQSNPFIDDKGLSPNTRYYYRAVAFNASVSSPASAEVSRNASLPCPDLVVDSVTGVEIINSSTGAVITDTTKVPSGTSIKFRAKIRNQNGPTPTLTPPGFYNQFVLDNLSTQPFSSSQQSLQSLGQGALSDFLTTGSWSPTVGSHALQVCADMPPNDGRGNIREDNNAGNAEQNNCLPQTFSFSVVTPITVQLQCEQSGGTFKNDYCVIDYAQASGLRWTVSGAPSTCSWVTPPSDTSGTANGNTLSLTNLLSKLNFKYQLKCE
ncbi:MAG: hypothetical protein G01um101470_217, partial [Parcubacteria group bacterium Gr01-1014_70]